MRSFYSKKKWNSGEKIGVRLGKSQKWGKENHILVKVSLNLVKLMYYKYGMYTNNFHVNIKNKRIDNLFQIFNKDY